MSEINSKGDHFTNELHKAAEALLLSKKRSVLLVEDSPAHAVLVRRALEPHSWDVEQVTRIEAAKRAIQQDPERIIVLDLSLPDGSGLSLLAEVKSVNPHTPVVVITSADSVDQSVQAMKSGADDYVVKDSPQTTSERIRNAVESAWSRRIKNAESLLVDHSKVLEYTRSQRMEAIQVVVRTVSHEINNPLSGVLALSQLLTQHEDASPELKRLLEAVHSSAKEVAEAVSKLQKVRDQIASVGGKEVLEVDHSEK